MSTFVRTFTLLFANKGLGDPLFKSVEWQLYLAMRNLLKVKKSVNIKFWYAFHIFTFKLRFAHGKRYIQRTRKGLN